MPNLLPIPGYQNDLSIFIGELRDLLFASQEEAAAYFYLNRSRISRYEDAKAKDKPQVGYVASLACLLSARNNNAPETQQTLLQEINKVARQDYRRRKFRDWEGLCQTADAYLSKQRARRVKAAPKPESQSAWQASLKDRLDLPSPAPLIGVESRIKRLLEALTVAKAPWLVSIEGLGGLGKTALANALIRHPQLSKHFAGFAWVSAKQHDFSPGIALEVTEQPALSIDALIDALLEQLDSSVSLSRPLAHKKTALRRLLSQKPHLIVIDNLETVIDYQTLLPDLQKLANPGKIILTSRHSLRAYPDLFCFSLNELSRPDAIRLIRQEAETRGVNALREATEGQLEKIFEAVGGNPLALKLIVGQVSLLPLPKVLENLRKRPAIESDALYTYIYWQSWQLLTPAARQLLLIMPLAHNSAIDHLLFLSQLERPALNGAIKTLLQLSLLQAGGDLEERRYAIHRLTETFLLNEAIQWKASP